jgi:hypothetical protein
VNKEEKKNKYRKKSAAIKKRKMGRRMKEQ